YHDTEWCVPEHHDRKLYELLVLEAMSCGLSWELMLKKREIFRECFAGFDYEAVAAFGEPDIERILAADGMIRSRSKVEGMIANARAFCRVREEYGSFDAFLWGFTGGKVFVYEGGEMNAISPLSEQVSKEMKKRGFKYLGPVITYSYLQACGLINDHDPSCPEYARLLKGTKEEQRALTLLPPDEHCELKGKKDPRRTCEMSCGFVLFTWTEEGLRYVITRNRKGIYGLPKGHRNAGETEIQAALRETEEETGIRAERVGDFEMTEYRFLPEKGNACKNITLFLGKYQDQEIHRQVEELTDCVLMSKEEALKLLPEGRVKEIFLAASEEAERIAAQGEEMIGSAPLGGEATCGH
ncbi:MAG: DNA-3-methyladenine glycosylase I, partial [Lachnospiraceae bacterium]|nr:DNA-3-methyladenine glycosylase I [Lachnospiraceae bacterium]